MLRRVGIGCLFFCIYLGLGCGGSSESNPSHTLNPVPTLTSLSPNSAFAASSAFPLAASGSNFIPSSTVLFNGAPAPTTFVSPSSLTAQIPASALSTAGSTFVTVQNATPGGGTSNAITFTINVPQNPVPAITSLSPASAAAGGSAFALTVAGTQFASTSTVLWNGAAVPTTFVSSSTLMAQIPASALSLAGSATITVQNPAPGGGTSNALIFTISARQNPVPTLAFLSPSSIAASSSAFTLMVTGTQFTLTSNVLWNGVAVPTTYVSGSSLNAQIPASDVAAAGSATVAVLNPAPGGGTSNPVTFTISAPQNPVPTISSLSPSTASVGSRTLTLLVTGTQFISASVVMWNGSAVPTTFVSDTSLNAQIPASDLNTAGTAAITVQDPGPGGGTSSSLLFTIAPPVNNLTVLGISGSDIVWDASQKKIYVAASSTSSTQPGTVTVVDPVVGSLGRSLTLLSAPSGLAISDNDQYLYAVVGSGTSIQRLTLPALQPDIQWSLGADKTFGASLLAGDIKVQPGSPHTLAVSMGQYGSGSVAIFDDAVERAAVGGGEPFPVGNSLQWSADGSKLYAAYTVLNDSPYYATVSDDALYTMPVTSAGIEGVTTYDSTFRREGGHLHLESATGDVYGDWCEIINPVNGIAVGNCRLDRPDFSYQPGALTLIDSGLNRIFTLLEVPRQGEAPAYRIQAFDRNDYQLLNTIYIPAGSSTPTNFIRWGQSGLAFVTNGTSADVPGNLYLLDGSFINPSGSMDTSAGSPLSLVPTLTAISPVTAAVGSGTITVTINGRDFSQQSTVNWNGAALTTAVLSSTQISAQVPESDLASTSLVSITVSNGANAAFASNSMPFSVNPAAPAGNKLSVYFPGGNDVVWDPTTAKLYVSMDGSQGDLGDAIGLVDPVAGTLTNSGFIGSDPDRLSISSDGQFLYASFAGETAIRQLTLPDFQKAAEWNLGGQGIFGGPYYALDLQASPGDPSTTAVLLAQFAISPSSAGIVIYDGPTARPTRNSQYSYGSLQWAGDGTLYGLDQGDYDLLALDVSSTGVALKQAYVESLNSFSPRFHFDSGNGLLYTDGGQALQPSDGTVVGTYDASGITASDSTLNRVFILGQTSAQVGTSSYTVESFDQKSFASIGSMSVDNVVGQPAALIRWGTNGLAFVTRVGDPYGFESSGPGQLYVISGDFVKPSNSTSQIRSDQAVMPVRRTWDAQSTSKPKVKSFVIHTSN